MASLSVGGNDIDFPGIIFNCILEWHLPFDAGPPNRTCDEQRKITWDLLASPDLADNVDHTIKKTVSRGRQGAAGDQFRLYVTGFPQFFSVQTVRNFPVERLLRSSRHRKSFGFDHSSRS